MKRHLVTVLSSCAFLCAIASVARAQGETSPPPASAPAIRSSSSSHSGGPWGVGGIGYVSGFTGLSVGGGLAYQYFNQPGPPAPQNNLLIEIGGLIRVFLTSNVALGAGTGFVIRTADASGYDLGATNLVGTASIHYYF